MKITIPQIALNTLIARGGATVAKGSPVPIYGHFRLIADEDNTLKLASTDHDRFAEAVTTCDVAEPGACTVDGEALKALIGRYAKTGHVTLETIDGRIVVSCGRSKVKIPTLKAEDFPTWADKEPIAEFVLSGEDFERGFTRVRFAASSGNPAQFYLEGVHLDAHDNRLHFVATDGTVLAVSGMMAPEGAADCPRITIPSEGVDAALAVFKGSREIAVTVSDGAVSFKADNLRLASLLIAEAFPAYERIIPARGNPGLTVKRADFVDCLARAGIVADSKVGEFSAVTARPDADTLRLEARNAKGGEVTEELPAQIDESFKPFGFSPKYAAAFLTTLNVSDLTIEQSSAAAPHLIYADDAPDFVGVLSPIRIRG